MKTNHGKDKSTHLKYKIINIRYKLLGNQEKGNHQLYTQPPQFKTLCSIKNFGKQKWTQYLHSKIGNYT